VQGPTKLRVRMTPQSDTWGAYRELPLEHSLEGADGAGNEKAFDFRGSPPQDRPAGSSWRRAAPMDRGATHQIV
jgi:hypothetical protein